MVLGVEIMDTGNRPLSPHLQVYRLPLAGILSFAHRTTGVGLALGALALAYWINAAAYGPDVFYQAQTLMGHWFSRLLLFGWTLSLFFHLCNGIRHLFWDAGIGLEIEQVNMSGWLVLIGTILLTLLSWLAGYGLLG
jgi:succinate dehydrogenase / fumarate reductase cytochrome b subunit